MLSVARIAILSLAGLALCPAAVLGENRAFYTARESITIAELFDHVDVLADDTLEGRAAGTRGGHAAARYVETQLRELRVRPAGERGRYTQIFHGSYRNLLARIDGSDERLKDEFLVLGAHYDHVGYGTSQTSYGPIGYIHNGADDNASGVSVLLEIIEAITRLDQPPRRSILFAFWDGEEQGLLGSKHWVRQPTVPLSAVRLALNVDMVGRMRDGKLEVGGTRTGYGLRRLLASRLLDQDMWLDYDWELEANSDHWPFFERGIPVVLLHTGLHDDYHRPSDDVQRVNQQGMRKAATYLFDVVYRAANANELPAFRAQAQSETPHTQRYREQPQPPLPPRLGVTFRDVQPPAPQDDNEAGLIETGDTTSIPTGQSRTGVVVTSVTADSPAAVAGLRTGDRIEQLGGEPVLDGDHFLQLIHRQPAETRLRIRRGIEPEPRSLDVTLAGVPIQVGISWRTDEAEPGAVYLTRVVAGSPASKAGLRVHDRIYQVNGRSFDGVGEFWDLLKECLALDEPLTLTTERAGRITDIKVDALPAQKP